MLLTGNYNAFALLEKPERFIACTRALADIQRLRNDGIIGFGGRIRVGVGIRIGCGHGGKLRVSAHGIAVRAHTDNIAPAVFILAADRLCINGGGIICIAKLAVYEGSCVLFGIDRHTRSRGHRFDRRTIGNDLHIEGKDIAFDFLACGGFSADTVPKPVRFADNSDFGKKRNTADCICQNSFFILSAHRNIGIACDNAAVFVFGGSNGNGYIRLYAAFQLRRDNAGAGFVCGYPAVFIRGGNIRR